MSIDPSLTLIGFLDALASNDPAPGGGAAAALAGAAGTSLLLMVAGLPKTRTDAPEEVADMAEAAAALRPLREALVALIQQDSDAYRAVLAAYRLEKGDAARQVRRREAIQHALRGAIGTPLATLRACRQGLALAPVVAQHALPSARSDVAVGIDLLAAAARGGSLNVDANLPGLADPDYAAVVRGERQQLTEGCEQDAAAARELLR